MDGGFHAKSLINVGREFDVPVCITVAPWSGFPCPNQQRSDPVTAASAQPAARETIQIIFGGAVGFTYSPKDVRIRPGDSIEWMGDFTMHPLVSEDGLWQTVDTGADFTFTFNQPGVYKFHCFFHNSIGMNGTITVGYYAYLPLIVR